VPSIRSALTLRRALLAAALLVAATLPAAAIVGDSEVAAAGVAQHLVQVRGRGGSLCTGAVIAQDLVLTAGHCLSRTMRVRAYGDRKLIPVVEYNIHKRFKSSREGAAPESVDLMLLKLAKPLPERARPALLARAPASIGEAVLVAGYGLDDPDATSRRGRPRMATLINIDRKFGVSLVLRDPTPDKPQVGACSGDSGGPAFAARDGLAIVGVVSAGPRRCGGFTFVTPIAPYYDWIVDAVREAGSSLAQ
jgi:hypothetical protein